MKTNSIRFKTTGLGTCILGVVLILFSVYLVHSSQRILYKEEEEEISVKAQEITDFIDAYAKISQEDKSPKMLIYQLLGGKRLTDRKIVDQLWREDSKTLGLQNDFYRIRDLKGVVIFRSDNLITDAEKSFDTQFARFGNATHFSPMKINGVLFYGINYPVRFSNRNELNLQLAMPIMRIQRILYKLEVALMSGVVFVLLISIFVGMYLTRRVLKPVEEVTRVANHITQKDLNMRIPIRELDKEMEELVASFNHMIERLEQSFAHVNEFSSHVAHELKTPLAIIKNELELAINSGNSKQENERVMVVTLNEVDRLIRIIKDLFLLAKLEYKLNIFKMEKIDLTDFLKDVYQHCQVLASEKNISLELIIVDHPIRIQGDAVHLRRVFFNLLHNAVNFTLPGGQSRSLTRFVRTRFLFQLKIPGSVLPRLTRVGFLRNSTVSAGRSRKTSEAMASDYVWPARSPGPMAAISPSKAKLIKGPPLRSSYPSCWIKIPR